MKRILLSAIASVALSCGTTPEASAHGAHDESAAKHHEHQMHHEKKHPAMTGDEMAKGCEDRMAKIKDTGASLTPKMKTKFDYRLKRAALEVEVLRNADMDEHHKHAEMCHSELKVAEQIVKKHEHQLALEKKMEEKKTKAAERKARAEENKAKAAERKAKRDEERKAKKASHAAEKAASHSEHVKIHSSKKGGSDNGRIEGVDTTAPGSDAAKPMSEEKK